MDSDRLQSFRRALRAWSARPAGEVVLPDEVPVLPGPQVRFTHAAGAPAFHLVLPRDGEQPLPAPVRIATQRRGGT